MASTSPPRAEHPEAGQRIVLHGVRWEFYETLLAELGDSPIHVTYDRGDLEIMSPSSEHEIYGWLIGRMLSELTLELNIPIKGAGSTTFKSKERERGLEPDRCFYIAHEPLVRGKLTIDLDLDPPPDLAVEIDVTSSSLDRLGIYAALGVPEIWRFDGEAIEVYQLQPSGQFTLEQQSHSLPFLPVSELVRFLHLYATTDETGWMRSFRDWVRSTLAPRMPARDEGGS
jgi:Uma2 family endonuclease